MGKESSSPHGKSTTKAELFWGLFELCLKIDFSSEQPELTPFLRSTCQQAALLSLLIRDFLIIAIII